MAASVFSAFAGLRPSLLTVAIPRIGIEFWFWFRDLVSGSSFGIWFWDLGFGI
jgi:hypothetical protein